MEEAVARGLVVGVGQHPELLFKVVRRGSEAEKKRFEELQRLRDRKAHELGLDPTVIASRAALSALAQDWDAGQASLMRWQRELLN